MDWRTYINELYDQCDAHKCALTPKFYPPVLEHKLITLQSHLQNSFPDVLLELLQQTNGVMECMLLEQRWQEIGWFLWPAEEILRQNLWARSSETQRLYNRQFQHWLFFATSGVDGIWFAFSMLNAHPTLPDVYAWNPIEGTITRLASSFKKFVAGWIGGRIHL